MARRMGDACNRGDVDAVVGLFAADAVLQTGVGRFEGREAIRGLHGGLRVRRQVLETASAARAAARASRPPAHGPLRKLGVVDGHGRSSAGADRGGPGRSPARACSRWGCSRCRAGPRSPVLGPPARLRKMRAAVGDSTFLSCAQELPAEFQGRCLYADHAECAAARCPRRRSVAAEQHDVIGRRPDRRRGSDFRRAGSESRGRGRGRGFRCLPQAASATATPRARSAKGNLPDMSPPVEKLPVSSCAEHEARPGGTLSAEVWDLPPAGRVSSERYAREPPPWRTRPRSCGPDERGRGEERRRDGVGPVDDRGDARHPTRAEVPGGARRARLPARARLTMRRAFVVALSMLCVAPVSAIARPAAGTWPGRAASPGSPG